MAKQEKKKPTPVSVEEVLVPALVSTALFTGIWYSALTANENKETVRLALGNPHLIVTGQVGKPVAGQPDAGWVTLSDMPAKLNADMMQGLPHNKKSSLTLKIKPVNNGKRPATATPENQPVESCEMTVSPNDLREALSGVKPVTQKDQSPQAALEILGKACGWSAEKLAAEKALLPTKQKKPTVKNPAQSAQAPSETPDYSIRSAGAVVEQLEVKPVCRAV